MRSRHSETKFIQIIKQNRSDPPDDLKPQFDIIKKVPEHFNLKSIEFKGFEADDLIASYSKGCN